MGMPGTLQTAVAKIVVSLVLLLGVGAAQAATVVFGDSEEPNKATGILNLEVPGFGTFDVAFDQQAFSYEIYGSFPGDLSPLPPFFTLEDTETAANAVNAALNAEGVLATGEVGLPGTEAYNIGFTAFICCTLPIIDDDPSIPATAVIRSLTEGGTDWFSTGENFISWEWDERDWAVFTMSGSACGNGVVQVGEECDDGNTTSGDGCSSTCMFETEAFCGNTVVEADEECDDGNNTSGDGCSDVCMLEVEPVCGNEIVEVGEQCDDGNTTPGDGCSDTCTVEAGQDATVVFGDSEEPNKATGILNLNVPGFGAFDVVFDQQAFPFEIYGFYPGDLSPLPPFFTLEDTETASNAVNAALSAEGVLATGEVGLTGTEAYSIGFTAFTCCTLPVIDDDPSLPAIAVIRSLTEGGADWFSTGENFLLWNGDERDWAVFTPIPEPRLSLLSVAALITLGFVALWRRAESEGAA
jgi:cysteine-rich repeat protein